MPAGPSPTAFSFISSQACLRKGEGAGGWIREFSFGFEKRNHLAVGEKYPRALLCCLLAARQHELKGLRSPQANPTIS